MGVTRNSWSRHHRTAAGERRGQSGSAAGRWGVARHAALIISLVFSAFILAATVVSREHPWLCCFSLIPLLAAVRVLMPVSAAVAGGFWGVCLYLAFSVCNAEDVFPGSLLSLALLTLVPAAYTGLGALLTRRTGFDPFVLALGWVAVELALVPVDLRLGLLAGSQGDGALVRWIGNAFGYVAVAFLIALANAGWLEFWAGIRLPMPRPKLLLRTPEVRLQSRSGGASFISTFIIPALRPRAPPMLARPAFVLTTAGRGRTAGP
jgi:apolipoprotein N-acyltransferase